MYLKSNDFGEILFLFLAFMVNLPYIPGNVSMQQGFVFIFKLMEAFP
jgi:hypothetical protein